MAISPEKHMEAERRQDAIAEELRARLLQERERADEAMMSAVHSRKEAEVWHNACMSAKIERDKAQELYSQTIEDCAGALKGGEWAPARWDNPLHATMCEEAVKEARTKVEELEFKLKRSESMRKEADLRIATLTEEVCGMKEEIKGHLSTLHFLRVAVREREKEAEEAVARAEREAESLRHWQWEPKAKTDVRVEGVEVSCQTLECAIQRQVPDKCVPGETDEMSIDVKNPMRDVAESRERRRMKVFADNINQDIIQEWKELKAEKEKTGFMPKTEPRIITTCPANPAPLNLNLTVNGINLGGGNEAIEKSLIVPEKVTEPSHQALLDIPINPIVDHIPHSHGMKKSMKTGINASNDLSDVKPAVSAKEEGRSEVYSQSSIPFPFSSNNPSKKQQGLQILSEREEKRLMRRTQFEEVNVRISDLLGRFTPREGASTVVPAAPVTEKKTCILKDKDTAESDVKTSMCCQSCPLHQLCSLCYNEGGKTREINPVSGSFTLAEFDVLAHTMLDHPTDGGFCLNKAKAGVDLAALEWFNDISNRKASDCSEATGTKIPSSPKRRLR